jgi:hypothetical protein
MKFLAACAIFLVFLSIPSYCQNDIMQTISPAGGNGGNSNVSMDWSIGQVAVSTLASEQAILTQGLLQENILITGIGRPSEKLPDIRVFPNPTAGQLIITISDNKPLIYNLTDLNGKLLLNGQCLDIENILDLKDLPVGEYILNISDKSTQDANSYKITKL